MSLEQLLNHLRLAVRNAVILLPTVFLLGMAAGWAISQWNLTILGAITGWLIPTAACTWLTRAYYKTRGLMHYGPTSSSQ